MKFGKRLTIMERTFKDRGEVSYIISPGKELFPSPLILSREIPVVLEEFKYVRQQTLKLCDNLYPEDFVLQEGECVRSTKWHLAHATWFFESYILRPYLHSYVEFNAAFYHLFRFSHQPCHFSRPTVDDIYAYRTYVDAAIEDLLFHHIEEEDLLQIQKLLEVGIHYEAEIQEKILTDIKYHFSLSPLWPAYEKSEPSFQTERVALSSLGWVEFSEGLYNIGSDAVEFTFDHERPRHTVYISGFALANRLITNREYKEFIEDGGYQTKELWLYDGWKQIQETKQGAPLYWKKEGNGWVQFTLRSSQPLIDNEPVSHVSYYEAAAFARWSDARLPTEAEWEAASSESTALIGNFFRPHILQPIALKNQDLKKTHIHQLFGDVWEWTSSPFLPYPGFKRQEEFSADYHTKFMSNHIVLRGGSCLTPESYYRNTYRYFQLPCCSIACSGIRLAKDLSNAP